MTKQFDLYEQRLIESVSAMFPSGDAGEIVKHLLRIGVVDSARCKVMVVRQAVERLFKEGHGKVDSMFMVADAMCCSYEYVRKCVYQHRDVNLN